MRRYQTLHCATILLGRLTQHIRRLGYSRKEAGPPTDQTQHFRHLFSIQLGDNAMIGTIRSSQESKRLSRLFLWKILHRQYLFE